MKIVLISDVHGSYRFLTSLYAFIQKSRNDFSAIVFAGDLVDMGEPVSFVDEFLWMLEELNIELLWVPGNNDFGRAYHRLNARIKSLEGKIIESKSQKYTGVGGSPASWSGQYQGEQSVNRKAIADTIFISHVPPPGIVHYEKFDKTTNHSLSCDENMMTHNPTSAKSKIKLADCPLVHVCGHVHHTWGIGHLGSTKVIKLAAAYLGHCAIMDTKSLKVEFERLW